MRSKKEYCLHLKNYKGSKYQGKPVFETLHGVRFSGLGLLAKQGADPDARITQVAEENGGPLEDQPNESGTPGEQKPTENSKIQQLAKQLELFRQENESLKTANQKAESELQALQKQIHEWEAKEQAMARKQRAEALLARIGEGGISFATDEGRRKELQRLASLDDQAFSIASQTYSLILEGSHSKPKTPASTPVVNQSQADYRPADVDDEPEESLTNQLTRHMVAAFAARQQ